MIQGSDFDDANLHDRLNSGIHVAASKTPELWDRIAADNVVKEDYQLNPDWGYLLMTVDGEPVGYWVVHGVNTATIMIHCNVLEQYRKPHYKEFGRLIYEWFIEKAAPNFKKLVAEVPVCFDSVCDYCEYFGMKKEGVSPKSQWRKGALVDRFFYGISREQIKEFLEKV